MIIQNLGEIIIGEIINGDREILFRTRLPENHHVNLAYIKLLIVL